MIYKNALLLFFSLLVISIALWTTILSLKRKTPVTLSKVSKPDAYMENVIAQIMDKQGKLKMKIVTPKVVYYSDKNISHLTTPTITLYRRSTWPWYISSKTAEAIDGIERINFYEDVAIQHPADQSNPATLINTTTLVVFPNKQIAQTEAAITFCQPNLKVTAKGMFADMDKGSIKLLAETRGEYAPTP
ncbi:MAG: LPS export ABC transporter periplasmic protein LptC [Gammaproteobacteria bacterium]|nr:LPS export ABC transporter periplasmic protein LptC [Gammaproteobacteria bacterium]